MFTRTGNTWQQSGSKIIAASGNYIYTGRAVAISTNGRTAFIRSIYPINGQGGVWAFVHAAKQSQIIVSLTRLYPISYVNPNIQLTATSTNSTLPIVFSSSDTTIAKIINGDLIHPYGVGTVTITASQPGNANYSDAVPLTWSLTIGKGTLIVTPNNKTVTTGFTSLSFTASYQGFINGDTVSSISTKPTITTTATASSPPGNYPITVSGAVSSKYDFVYKGGTLTLTGKPLGPPQIASFSPQSGSVGSLITITGTNLNYLRTLTIGGKTAIVVSGTNNKVVSMVMPGAGNGAITLSTDSGTTMAAGSFTVKPATYPSVQQGGKIIGAGSIGKAAQGNSVALSADGNTAVVGGPGDSNGQGAAWIYTRNGNTWQQQGDKLVGTGNVGAAAQGKSVAISADGNTVIIGGADDNNLQGAAWVFTREGDTWQQDGDKLTVTGNIGAASLGYKVAISADGNTAVLGAPNDNARSGAVWVFMKQSGSWQQGDKLVGEYPNPTADEQGSSIALSSDGNTLISCSIIDQYFTYGAAWVFVRNGLHWVQQGFKLVGDNIHDGLIIGYSVELTADGDQAVITGQYSNYSDIYEDDQTLIVYNLYLTFTRAGGVWTMKSFKQLNESSNYYGGPYANIAISANGISTLTSSPTNYPNMPISVTSSNGINNTELLVPGVTANALALSSDGSTALVADNTDNSNTGSVRVFISAEKQAQQITFSPGPVYYGAPDTLLVATSTNSSLPIKFASSDTTVADL